MKLFSDIFEK